MKYYLVTGGLSTVALNKEPRSPGMKYYLVTGGLSTVAKPSDNKVYHNTKQMYVFSYLLISVHCCHRYRCLKNLAEHQNADDVEAQCTQQS